MSRSIPDPPKNPFFFPGGPTLEFWGVQGTPNSVAIRGSPHLNPKFIFWGVFPPPQDSTLCIFHGKNKLKNLKLGIVFCGFFGGEGWIFFLGFFLLFFPQISHRFSLTFPTFFSPYIFLFFPLIFSFFFLQIFPLFPTIFPTFPPQFSHFSPHISPLFSPLIFSFFCHISLKFPPFPPRFSPYFSHFFPLFFPLFPPQFLPFFPLNFPTFSNAANGF